MFKIVHWLIHKELDVFEFCNMYDIESNNQSPTLYT
jgi:hypothetical protein